MRWALVLSLFIVFFTPQQAWVKPKVRQHKVVEEDYGRLKATMNFKDEDAFMRAVSQILGKDTKNLKALNALGLFYSHKAQLGMAKLVYSRALESYKNEPGLHNNLGVVYLRENHRGKAIAAFEKSISLNKSYTPARVNLSSLLVEYRDYRRALEPLESGYKSLKSRLKSNDQEAIYVANNYAVALMGLGEKKSAKRVFKKVLDSGGKDTFLLYNYAILLVDILKEREEALRVVSKLKFNTDDPKMLRKVDKLEERLDKL